MHRLSLYSVHRWLALAALVIAPGLIGLQPAPVAQAQSVLPDPRAFAVTADEVGPGLALVREETGGDARIRWARLRWERDPEDGSSSTTGRIVENRIWVAADVQLAQEIFASEAARQAEFPEAMTQPQGPFELAVGPIADEVAALSACDDCLTRGALNLHHRVVMRNGTTVAVLYTSGPEAVATQADMSWLAARAGHRLTGAVLAERPGADAELPADGSLLVRAVPRDLAITVNEAGTDAVLVNEREGADARSTWYLARYERPHTEDALRTGPSVIVNDVLVARNVATAREIYAEQIARNELFPEARAGRIQETSVLDADRIGDEAQGVLACAEGCTDTGDDLIHQRLVSRTANVVSIVYQYGRRGTFDSRAVHVRDFSRLVAARALAAPTTLGAAEDVTAVVSDTPVQARPHDLTVNLIEAGKDAELAEVGGGSDDLASWSYVRYERPQTYAAFRSGPVTVFNQVLVARNTAIAEEIFAAQAELNQSFPEAWSEVGGAFGFETGAIGDEVTGLAACTGSCSTRSEEMYLHRRVVSRTGNVVNVIYLWGLDHPEGLSPWHAQYFASLVDARATSSATPAVEAGQP